MERVVVVGPGAMGILLATSFAKAGIPVHLLDYRPDRARKLNAEGITLIDTHGEKHSEQISMFGGRGITNALEDEMMVPLARSLLRVEYGEEQGITFRISASSDPTTGTIRVSTEG